MSLALDFKVSETIKPSIQLLSELFRNPRDNLSVYLVAEDQKPAAVVSSSSNTNLNYMLSSLLRLNLHAKEDNSVKNPNTKNNSLHLIISKKVEIIDELILSGKNYDHKNTGILLGYPEDSSKHFSEQTKHKNTIHHDFLKQVMTYLYDGVKLPVSFAYALHVPNIVYTLNNEIIFDRSSNDLFHRYFYFVRKNNKDLAESIESHALNELNNYTISFQNKKKVRLSESNLFYFVDY